MTISLLASFIKSLGMHHIARVFVLKCQHPECLRDVSIETVFIMIAEAKPNRSPELRL